MIWAQILNDDLRVGYVYFEVGIWLKRLFVVLEQGGSFSLGLRRAYPEAVLRWLRFLCRLLLEYNICAIINFAHFDAIGARNEMRPI